MKKLYLEEILRKHALWLEEEEKGERADLSGANFEGIEFHKVNLENADVSEANFRGADLWRTNFQGANLRGIDFRESCLQNVNFHGSDMRNADLRGANIDFSCWPLWCGSMGIIVDLRIVYQLLAHVACLKCKEPEFLEIKKLIMPYALKSTKAGDLGLTADD